MNTEKRKIFLLSMDVNGIKNIEKNIHIDFYKNTISKNFDASKYSIKGIYGENGVGKSALITAAYIFNQVMISSRYLSNELNNKKLCYLINKNTNSAEISFDYLINEDEIINIYKYSIELKIENGFCRIVKESLYKRKSNNINRLIYEVRNGELTIKGSDIFERYIKEISKNLLKDRSLLSIIVDTDIDDKYSDTLLDMYNVINCGLYTYIYLNDKESNDNYIVNKAIREFINKGATKNAIPKITKTIKYLTCKGKTAILAKDFNYYLEEIKNLEKFIKIFKPDLKSIKVDKTINKDEYICELVFSYDKYEVAGEFESTGIKRLVELFAAFNYVSNGYVVFIDELDANIHDYYLCKLLDYVGEYTKGQLCFTTHNLGPMKILEKYKKSIDFISRNGDVVSWIKNGNYDVTNLYRNGKIEKSPFNIESFEFLSVFDGGDK